MDGAVLGRGLRTNRLDVGGDSDHHPDPGIFLSTIAFLNSYREPSINMSSINMSILGGGLSSLSAFPLNPYLVAFSET